MTASKTPFALLIALTACAPSVVVPDDSDVAGTSETGSEPEPEPETDDDPTATSTDGGGAESSSGETGSDPGCLLDASGAPCLDVLDHIDVCDRYQVGSLDHDQCAIALGRLFGSTHLAGSWAVQVVADPDCDLADVESCGMVGQQCVDLVSEVECALTELDDVGSCVEKISCTHEAGPSTCAALDKGVVEALCETLVG